MELFVSIDEKFVELFVTFTAPKFQSICGTTGATRRLSVFGDFCYTALARPASDSVALGFPANPTNIISRAVSTTSLVIS